MSLKHKLETNTDFVRLYGVTPPKTGCTPEKIEKNINLLKARIADLNLDGVVVYDVQDETKRNSADRPFAFSPNLDPLDYAKHIHDATGIPALCYKCGVHTDHDEFETWLKKADSLSHIAAISLVGGASSQATYHGISLPEAIEMANRTLDLPQGGVTIPERHATKGDEPNRILGKTARGMSYFITQAIYDANLCIQFLQDYAETCKKENQTPQRIVFTFAPCSREKTLKFMQWLGIQIPKPIETEILTAENPLAKSLDICERNFERILDVATHFNIPTGINIESVSISKAERDASIELFKRLEFVAQQKSGVSLG